MISNNLNADLSHVFEKHALRLLSGDNAQQANDVGMTQLRHEFHLAPEILLRLHIGVRLERFDGDGHNAARTDETVAGKTPVRRHAVAVHQLAFVHLSDIQRINQSVIFIDIVITYST